MHTLTVHPSIGSYTLLRLVEQKILEARIRGADGCDPIFVCQAFQYAAGYPRDPFSGYAKGFMDRIVEQAGKLGIVITFDPHPVTEESKVA